MLSYPTRPFWHLVKFIAYAADADDVVGVMIFTFQFFSQGADVDHDSFVSFSMQVVFQTVSNI